MKKTRKEFNLTGKRELPPWKSSDKQLLVIVVKLRVDMNL